MCSTIDSELDLDQLKRELDYEYNGSQQLDDEEPQLIEKLTIGWSKTIELVTFKHQLMTRFGIDCHNNYVNHQNAYRLTANRPLNAILDEGFFEALNGKKLIENYREYRHNKWSYFLKCLKQNELIGYDDKCFVSFAGPIADMMITPEKDDRPWRVLTQMFNKNIYLSKNRGYFDEANRSAYCGLKFLYLLTDRDHSNINEFEKCFAINRATLGEHNLMVLNEIDAIDDNDMPVELKKTKHSTDQFGNAYRNTERSFKSKALLNAWAQCSVSGVETVIFGFLDSNNSLESTKEYVVEEIPEDCGQNWSDIKCLHFLNRLLKFIKQCVAEEGVVYEFVFNKKEKFISCYRININDSSVLPKWYIDGKEDDGDVVKSA